MKKFIFFLILFLSIHTPVFANGAGLPPFFKINSKLSITNPLQNFGITSQGFLIPQDFAPENYIVTQPIQFEIDENQLLGVIPEDLISHTKFTWDFGDGSKAEGLKNTHAYSKIGSYILILTINIYADASAPPTQFIDSFLLNILPDKSYDKLPKAVIMVNGKTIEDPLKEILDVNFKQPISFDGSNSTIGEGKIIEYLWNFGDGETSNKKTVTHTYNQPYPDYETVVILRVKDSNGFISDGFVDMKNNPKIQNSSPVSSGSGGMIWVVGGIGLGVLFVLYFWKFFSRRNKAN